MENKHQSAFPASASWNDENPQIIQVENPGLTKREYLAGLAMQGLLANTIYHNPNERSRMVSVSALSMTAVDYADALLEALKKNKP